MKKGENSRKANSFDIREFFSTFVALKQQPIDKNFVHRAGTSETMKKALVPADFLIHFVKRNLFIEKYKSRLPQSCLFDSFAPVFMPKGNPTDEANGMK